MKKLLSGILAVGTVVGLSFAEAPKKAQVLNAGHYTAKLKPFVCSGCPEFIEKAMKETKGVDSVSLDETTLHFTVKKGASVKVDDLQKHLKVYADQMGMGADYSLSDIKPMKKAGEEGLKHSHDH